MSISSTVATLARSLNALAPDPDQQARLARLMEMPDYVTKERLDLWEAEVKPARADKDRSPVDAAIAAIGELGMINLYADIDDELTAEYLQNAIAALGAVGVPVEASWFDLSDW